MGDLLEIKNLSVNIGDKKVLDDVNLTIKKGEVHVLMGPNGAGKSTLMSTIMAHPLFQVVNGKIFFEGEDITSLKTDERARKGIFMSFQNPKEIHGVKVEEFIRQSMMANEKDYGSIMKFYKKLNSAMENLAIDPTYATRYVNVGFSGGEKKKNEILQMQMLDPKLALLDETDSGLDVDAVKVVSDGIKEYLNGEKSVLIITHHSEILDNIKADYVHILKNGRLAISGDSSLIDRIEKDGYSWVE